MKAIIRSDIISAENGRQKRKILKYVVREISQREAVGNKLRSQRRRLRHPSIIIRLNHRDASGKRRRRPNFRNVMSSISMRRHTRLFTADKHS